MDTTSLATWIYPITFVAMSHTLKTAGPFKILRKSPKFLEVRQPVTTMKHSFLSVRKPASKNRRQKRMENHFSAFWRVHFLLKHWQQNRQQKVGNSLDQCSARSKCRKNYRTIVFFTRVFPLLELSLDQRVSSSKL